MMEQDEDARMLRAIGGIVRSSGSASVGLQQMIADLSGTDLTYFMLQDATLGAQVKQSEAIVKATNTNEWITHPPVDSEMRLLALKGLSQMRYMTECRNRVVHDIWRPRATEEWPLGLEGTRATRWGKAKILSSLQTFHQLDSMFSLAAELLGAVGVAIVKLRQHDPEYVSGLKDDSVSAARRCCIDLARKVELARSAKLPGWRWEVIPLPETE